MYAICSKTPFVGRGNWIRTSECGSQSPMPFRLAIPLYNKKSHPFGWLYFESSTNAGPLKKHLLLLLWDTSLRGASGHEYRQTTSSRLRQFGPHGETWTLNPFWALGFKPNVYAWFHHMWILVRRREFESLKCKVWACHVCRSVTVPYLQSLPLSWYAIEESNPAIPKISVGYKPRTLTAAWMAYIVGLSRLSYLAHFFTRL